MGIFALSYAHAQHPTFGVVPHPPAWNAPSSADGFGVGQRRCVRVGITGGRPRATGPRVGYAEHVRWRRHSEGVETPRAKRAGRLASGQFPGRDGLWDGDEYFGDKPGLYEWVLREKAGIERIILDTSTDTPVEEVDRRFFSPVIRFRDFVIVRSRVELEALETRCGRKIHSLNDLVDSLKAEFRRVYPHVVGVKIGLAYMRTLKFDKVSFREAEEVFNNIYKQEMFDRITIGKTRRTVPAGLSLNECKPLQDFMVHKVIQFASEMDLPIQIHTGLQEGNENIITNSNPTLLVNLFREYKEVKFDIFHGSYPYIGELAALAKNFPNVYVDMCWLHIISPYKAREALSEWLDTVPSNKIFGFGGDYRFIEGVYGHSVIARENIAKVLADKVAEGILTDEQAMKIAEKLLRKNAEELFLKKRV